MSAIGSLSNFAKRHNNNKKEQEQEQEQLLTAMLAVKITRNTLRYKHC